MLFYRMMIILLVFFSTGFAVTTADLFPSLWKKHPFYFGPLMGYGSTDWSMLTVNCDTTDPLCDVHMLGNSAPVSAGDSGLSWGATIGYEVKPEWAMEASFIRFPTTTVKFDRFSSAFYIDRFQLIQIRSDTWAFFLVGKFMTEIGHSGVRGFANAGLNFSSRSDEMTHKIQPGPTFGLGINYVFPSRMMLELGFQYMTGYGRATERPAEFYLPFLYSLHAKLMYRI